MNQVIKNKKKERLFCKKYPRLFALYSSKLITKRKVEIACKKLKGILTEDEISYSIHMMVVFKVKNHIPRVGSKGDQTVRLFNKLNIKI
ncbi:hypothetical protein G9F71_008950 [Clostridium sp. FP2]|uniref:hypothetical protein n=1 Tax=Clostridium sp. FP2 TaxID=2724481 RepID=UPI0013E91BBA|nr:hypothetical protein [Clostridium sp. FP2]MBZ9622982.1 hypothetical protein [Clostridium sp. FP2]